MNRILIPSTLDTTPPALGAVVHRLAGTSMGTSWSVALSASPGIDLGRWQRGVQAQLDRVVAEMSHWAPGSDLSRCNDAAPDTWHAVPPGFARVLEAAITVAETSGGAFDPCAGALVELWGFGARARHDEPGFRLPDDDAVAAARARGGWRRLRFDAQARRLHQPGGMRLDLSAIAKGHGVDAVATWLEAQGVADFLVEVGGELRGRGMKPGGQPWWVQLESPPGASQAPLLVALHGMSIATSGDYRRWHRGPDGALRSHTVDPRSGHPVAHGLASVSVLHREAMWADAWSTAITVLGPHDGLRLAESLGLAARLVTRRGDGCEESMTTALQAWLS